MSIKTRKDWSKFLNKTFNSWTVKSIGEPDHKGKRMCEVLCECGTVGERNLLTVRRGVSKSCGCHLRTEYKYKCSHCDKDFVTKGKKYGERFFYYCSRDCMHTHRISPNYCVELNLNELDIPEDINKYVAQDKVCCLFKDCEWEGRSFANHAFLAHAIDKKELKHKLGINQTSALCTNELSEEKRESANHHRAYDENLIPNSKGKHTGFKHKYPKPKEATLQAIETKRVRVYKHAQRECSSCSVEFSPIRLNGSTTKYCCCECRKKGADKNRLRRIKVDKTS